MKKAHFYTLYWQLKKSLKSLHFHISFFLLSQLIWPLILVTTFYFSYTPILNPVDSVLQSFSGGTDLYTFLIPGIIVLFLYMEYVSLGFGLSMDRDYGVLEPIFLTPVNRLLWLFGTALSILPSGILASTGFLLSSHLLFGISLPHPFIMAGFILFIIISSIPWGSMVCAIFLSGRNTRFLYTIFETPAEFLSGSRFPIVALPAFFSGIALFYPLSHGITLLRFSWHSIIPWNDVLKEVIWIIGLGILYTCISIFIFTWAEERGKRNGTLAFT